MDKVGEGEEPQSPGPVRNKQTHHTFLLCTEMLHTHSPESLAAVILRVNPGMKTAPLEEKEGAGEYK